MSEEIDHPPRSWVPGTVVLVLVVVLVFVLRDRLPVEGLEPLQDWVKGFGTGGAFVLALLIMLVTTVGVPGSLSAIVSGLALGMWVGMLTAWVGITAGAGLCFLLSRWFFEDRVAAYVEKRPRMALAQRALRERGWRVLLLLRLTPLVPLIITNYVSGVSGVKLSQAILATAIGIVPAMFVYVGLGAAGSSEPETSAWLVGIGLVATIGLGIVARRILGEVMAS